MMQEIDVYFDPRARSDEDCRLICAVPDRVAPLDSELVGDQKLMAVSRGAVFAETTGGRSLALMEVLAHLSTVASLTQCAIACLLFVRSKYMQSTSSSVDSSAQIKAQVKAAMLTRIAAKPELLQSISAQPDLLDTIIAALDDIGVRLDRARWSAMRPGHPLFAAVGLAVPAIVFCGGALASGKLGWWILAILPLWILISWVSQTLALYLQTLKACAEFSFQLDQLMPMQLIPVSRDEHRAALSEFILRTDGAEARSIPVIHAQTEVQMFVVQSTGGPELGGLKAYSGGGSAWLLLHQHVDSLTGTGHFQVLHELGHSGPGSVGANMHLPLRIVGTASAVLTLLLANWTALVLASTSLWLVLLYFWTREIARSARIADELSADAFALRVATPNWFTRGTLEEYADRLFRDCPHPEGGLRRRAFLDALRSGPDLSKFGFEIVQPIWFRLVAVCTIVIWLVSTGLAGTHAAGTSFIRTGAFFVVTAGASLLMIMLCLALGAACDRVQWLVGSVPKVPPDYSGSLLAKFGIPLVSDTVLVKNSHTIKSDVAYTAATIASPA